MKIRFMVIFVLTLAMAVGAQTEIQQAGSCAIPHRGWTVEVSGNYAFIACDSSGLQIVDISDPENPIIIANYPTPSMALDLCLSGDYVYVADYNSLQIIDISDPILPAYVGSYEEANILTVNVNGNYAFVGRGYNVPAFETIDISDPENPFFVSGLTFYGGAGELCYSGGYLYVLSNVTEPYSNFLRAIDMNDPENPYVAGSVQISGTYEISGDVKIDGQYAYIANRSYGLEIVNISDPENMEMAGGFNTPGNATSVYVQNDFAMIADYFSGLQVIGIDQPTNPYFWGYGFTGQPAIGVYGSIWDRVCVTTTDSLLIFTGTTGNSESDVPVAPTAFTSQNYPNPFNASTTIRYFLPKAAYVTMEVYDPLGRLVDITVDEERPAGQSEVVWNAGNLPSGIYFYRLASRGVDLVNRMVLIK